jgi:transcriptional regulator of acetoin/glycerol metabolism
VTLESDMNPAVGPVGGAMPTEDWEIQPLDTIVTKYVAAAVAATKGNVRKAARKLEISPSTLYARLKLVDKS